MPVGATPFKSQCRQIKFTDKAVDHLNRIVLVDPVCEAFRKQRISEALHAILRTSRITLRSELQVPRFYTARVSDGPWATSVPRSAVPPRAR